MAGWTEWGGPRGSVGRRRRFRGRPCPRGTAGGCVGCGPLTLSSPTQLPNSQGQLRLIRLPVAMEMTTRLWVLNGLVTVRRLLPSLLVKGKELVD